MKGCWDRLQVVEDSAGDPKSAGDQKSQGLAAAEKNRSFC